MLAPVKLSPTGDVKYSFPSPIYLVTPRSLQYESTSRGQHGNSVGQKIKIPSGSRFAGRHAGGGTRKCIYGKSYYGSGYPYGSYGSTWVGGRPFPFHYWPIYVGPHEYYGASEYGPANSTDRPGGPMYTATVTYADPRYNTSEVYRVLGDRDSVNVVLAALRVDCDFISYIVLEYDPVAYNSSHAPPPVESIIQYYRASSFALSLDGYFNTAAAVTPAALSNNTGHLVSSLLPPSPLPSDINLEFLHCINQTVGKSLPLLEPESGNISMATESAAGAMIACMHLVLSVILVAGLVKGIIGWLYAPRGERGTLMDQLSDMASMISVFSG